MYIQYRIDRCEALGNCIDASIIMEVSVLRIQFVFIVFCNIPQTTEYLLLYSCCLYSTGITPTPLLSNLSTMALTKTSIIKTRAQARTEARTGTNVRTNDDTIAPAGRTIDSVDPVPVTDDLLFAGRPKTGEIGRAHV